MDEKILISVIIPVFNVKDYLERCVNSILQQTYKRLEIILIDDGSTDCSGAICDSLKKRDKRIVVIHKSNGGLSSARNAGIDVCGGEYISFVDSDDWIAEDMYEKMLMQLLSDNTDIVCAGRFDVFANASEYGLCPLKKEVVTATEGIKRILRWNNLDSSVCDKLFSRRLFRNIRFPEKRISEDVAVTYLLFEMAGRISLLPNHYYYYFHRENSITTAGFDEKKFDILINVNELDAFVKIHNELYNDFIYFKGVESYYLLTMLLKNADKDYCVERNLTYNIFAARKVGLNDGGKGKVLLIVESHYWMYFFFKKVMYYVRKVKRGIFE